MLVLTVNASKRDQRDRHTVRLYVDPSKHSEPFMIEVKLVEVKTLTAARLGFNCPKEVEIVRKELEDRERN